MPFLRPDADAVDGNWTDQAGGTSLFAVMDETAADDGDFAKSGNDPATDIMRVTLSNPAGSVDTGQPVTVRYRYGKSGDAQIDIVARLKEGANVRATWTHADVGALTTAAQVLSPGEKASITDWNAVEMEFEANLAAAGGPVTLEGYTTQGTTGTSLNLSKPSGTQSGDLILLLVGNAETGTASSFADNVSGFTLFESDFVASDYCDAAAYWRISDGTEGATFTVTHSGSTDAFLGYCLRVSGAHQTAPIETTTSTQSGNTGSPDISAITTSVDGCLGINLAIMDLSSLGFTTTGLSTWTPEAEYDSPGVRGISSRIATRFITTATTTALEEYGISDAGSNEVVTLTFAIKPPA